MMAREVELEWTKDWSVLYEVLIIVLEGNLKKSFFTRKSKKIAYRFQGIGD